MEQSDYKWLYNTKELECNDKCGHYHRLCSLTVFFCSARFLLTEFISVIPSAKQCSPVLSHETRRVVNKLWRITQGTTQHSGSVFHHHHRTAHCECERPDGAMPATKQQGTRNSAALLRWVLVEEILVDMPIRCFSVLCTTFGQRTLRLESPFQA